MPGRCAAEQQFTAVQQAQLHVAEWQDFKSCLCLPRPWCALQAHVEATRARLTELSSAGLALECSGWLDQLSQQLRQLSGRLLGPCGSGQGLLHVEAAVRAALDGWRCLLQPSG